MANTVNIGEKEYPYVKIGNQWWTTINLDWSGPCENLGIYGNWASTEQFLNAGRLYNNNESLTISSFLPSPWQLPSLEDFIDLCHFLDPDANITHWEFQNTTENLAVALAGTDIWPIPGSNYSKMNILPAGSADYFEGYFGLDHGSFRTTDSEYNPRYFTISYFNNKFSCYFNQGQNFQYVSIRLVSNEMPPGYVEPVITVTFDPVGGIAEFYEAEVDEFGKINIFPLAYKEGYTFKGWFLGSDYITEVDLERIYEDDTTLYAKWAEIPPPEPIPPLKKNVYVEKRVISKGARPPFNHRLNIMDFDDSRFPDAKINRPYNFSLKSNYSEQAKFSLSI